MLFEGEKELPSHVYAQDTVLAEEYLLTFGMLHDVTILSRSDLRVLGECQKGLGGHPCLRRVILQGRDILYITREKIRRFRRQDLIGRYETGDPARSFSSDSRILERQGVIYSMGSPMVMLDMVTHAATEVPCDQIYSYGAFCRIGEEDYIAGYAAVSDEDPGTYVAALQELHTMKTGLALPFELPAECRIDGIGFHNLSFMVITGPQDISAGSQMLPAPTVSDPDRTGLFLKRTLYCYMVSVGERKLVATQQIELSGNGELVSFPGIETYFVADNLYIDAHTRASRIYKMTGEIVWERKYSDANAPLHPVVPADGSCIYYMEHVSDGHQEGQWKNLLLEVDLKNMEDTSYPIGYDNRFLMKIVGCNEKELTLSSDTENGFFCIFDRERKTITKTIPISGTYRLYQVTHKQDCYLCRSLHTSVWRAYSEEGDYLFSQLMPEDMDYYNDTTLQGDLCIVKREAFRRQAPVFYRIAGSEDLNG